jgi:hypothetical protein
VLSRNRPLPMKTEERGENEAVLARPRPQGLSDVREEQQISSEDTRRVK